MVSLRVKNIGPLKDTGMISLKQINLFLGKQGSGKSIIMKILSYCQYVERQIMLDGRDYVCKYMHYDTFTKGLFQFYRFGDGLLCDDSFIDYEGKCVDIQLKGVNEDVTITLSSDFEHLRYDKTLCFIPSYRNLLTVVDKVDDGFCLGWNEARGNYSLGHPLELVTMPGAEYMYDKFKDEDRIRLKSANKDFSLFSVTSGLQFSVPIEVTCSCLRDGSIFIEEPELGLFPESQKDLVMKLVRDVLNKHNMLTITTYSPYFLSVINVLMKAYVVSLKDKDRTKKIIPSEYQLSSDNVSAYFVSDGGLKDILDCDIPMISGIDLDGVSDWVEGSLGELNEIF
jgi:hypothetical protein